MSTTMPDSGQPNWTPQGPAKPKKKMGKGTKIAIAAVAVAVMAGIASAGGGESTSADKASGTSASASASVPAKAKVPNVVGMDGASAKDELTRAGFESVQFASADKDDQVVVLPANWTVTKQSVKAGTKSATDRLIVLTATKNADSPSSSKASQGMTKAKYAKIRNGMTRSQVFKIAGGKDQCEQGSETDVAGVKGEYWTCYADNKLANAGFTFSDGKLVSKAQVGLK